MEEKNLIDKGITLIALVITIIILLILAGVTLSLMWNGGIINKSQQAVDAQSEAQAREELSLALVEYKMKTLMEKDYNGTLDTFLSTIPDKNWAARDAEEDNNYYEVEIGEWLFWINKQTNEIISKGKKNPVPPTALSFKASSYDVYIGGEDLNLLNNLNVTPANANKNLLEWTISSSEKATITNVILHGTEETTDLITVTVKSKEDASVNASCTINVKAIELTGITLPAKITIGVGKTESIAVTYNPTNATYKDLIWEVKNLSTDPATDIPTDVVTVENGAVTGVKAGKKIVTATSTKYTGISASCEVTVENILEISNLQQLKNFRDDVNGTNATNTPNPYTGWRIVLTDNIDLNEGKYSVIDGIVTFDSDAEEWIPIGNSSNYFKGNFDGQGYTISGLYINKPTNACQGLFGYVQSLDTENEQLIENIVLQDINLSGGDYSGGIAGNINNSTNINKCYVSGNIHQSRNTSGVGGIVGYSNGNSKISNCINYANITMDDYTYSTGGIVGNISSVKNEVKNCYNAGNIIGNTSSSREVGGICGNSYGSITSCYNIGNCQGSSAGGISGRHSTSVVSLCYSSGNISGSSYIGKIIGYARGSATINNCYYLSSETETAIGCKESGCTLNDVYNMSPLSPAISVINGNNAFTTDNVNIVLNFSE